MFSNPNANNPAKPTLKNIKNYLSAQVREAGFLPEWEKEQVLWRADVAKECTLNKSCLECGCETPDLYYGTEGCKRKENPCFPAMMNEKTWNEFKITNNIK